MAVIEATSQNIDELMQADYVVVDFYKEHCGGCVFMAPFYHKLANDLAFISFLSANTDLYPSLIERFQIQVLPTLLFFRKGRLIHRVEEGLDENGLKQHIAAFLYTDP